MNPSKEQIQWFWEQCGFRLTPNYNWLVSPDNEYCKYPPIDNNLLKYAMPKIREGDSLVLIALSTTSFRCEIQVHSTPVHYKTISKWDKDPALALFWAIYEYLGGNR